jgi:plastocyanin
MAGMVDDRRRRRRAGIVLVGMVLSLGAASGCGDDGGGPVELVEGVMLEIDSLDNTFRPGEVEIVAGTEVRWTNTGRNDHNVLPVEGDDWGAEVDDFAPGDTYAHRFTEPGTYPYYCSLHGTTTRGMVGTVVVTDP